VEIAVRTATLGVSAALWLALVVPVSAAPPPSVAGGGAGFFAPGGPFPGDRVQLELTAREGSGGSFTAVHHLSSGGVFTYLVGSIDCLAVDGNIAVATGVITQGVAGIGVDPVGTRVSFRITDSQPDVFDADLAFFSGHDIAPCTSDPILTWSVEQGNFTVRE
jgi:hypothetical protein